VDKPVDPRKLQRQTALRCLFLVAMHHGLELTPEQLAIANSQDTTGGVLRVMREAGLKGRELKRCRWDNLASLGNAFPAIAGQKDGTFVIVVSVGKTPEGHLAAAVVSPANEQAGVAFIAREEFLKSWNGTLILCKRDHKMGDENQPFGFRWFLPEIARQKHYFYDVALAATMANLIGFSIPLLYRVIIDKVVPHHSYQTLYAVILIFATVILFDGMFSYMRQYLMLFATNKIDARLGSRTFQHLLGLPLTFFEKTPAGILTRHLQQPEKIRLFMTGRLFQTFLDTAVLPVLIVLLAMYSFKLTLLVMGFSMAIASVIAIMIPTFRRQLNHLYQAEGARQGHLIETIHGMRTVKSLGLEPARKKAWDDKLAELVRRHTVVGKMGALANVLTNGLDKAMQITILAVGALDVFDGHLTIGALIAFNMLSNRVSGPLIQMVALINEFQETALSVKMLGTVMNHAPERSPGQRGIRPQIAGQLEFTDVTFRYPGAATAALDRVTFKVGEGQVIGIVGRSGSGKTTVTRLIQGIHSPQEGLIKLSGTDIRHIDLAHLRRSVGVVLQDNFLFRGTIKDNIAASRPNATLPEIMEAARLAGADEFIDRLPLSYETFIEEGATNFSGGQKQRLAIARTLLTSPKLLIFDEATSALDPESEAIVQKNLADIARGRTMLIVSHRLSSLVQSDAILVLEQGKVMDFAPHSALVKRCQIYRQLWQTQTQHVRQ
jgi:ATP-binding cassette, subfamily B, bacterial HlyB/CyaB